VKQSNKKNFKTPLLLLSAVFVMMCLARPVLAVSAAEIDMDVNNALKKLYASSPAAQKIAPKAKGILVFPSVIKAGLVVGGQYGDGALLVDGKTVGYYNTTAASYGLQAGAQSFGYAMFMMTDESMKYLEKSAGWEIGVGPSIVVVDKGLAKSLTTSSAKEDIYVFFFAQKGLMAGLGIQGSKITKINPDK
jgi:lipid-binding SYLF domain-containing protein